MHWEGFQEPCAEEQTLPLPRLCPRHRHRPGGLHVSLGCVIPDWGREAEGCSQVCSAERGGSGHQGGTPSPLNPGACQVGTGGKLGRQDTQGLPLHLPSLWDFVPSSCFHHAAPKGSYFSLVFLDTVDTRLFSGVFPLKTNKQNKERQDNWADNM